MTARSPRDELNEAPRNREELVVHVAREMWWAYMCGLREHHAEGIESFDLLDAIWRATWLHKAEVVVAAIEQHCWIAPNEPTGQMVEGVVSASTGRAAIAPHLVELMRRGLPSTYRSFRAVSPYAAEKKDATNV